MVPRLTLALVAVAVIAACAAPPAVPERAPSPTSRPVETSSSPRAGSTDVRPALVGTWIGVHNCQRIFDLMTAAGMPEQALLNVAESGTLAGVTTVDQIRDRENPCAGAVDQRHSHFFTADGLFGSRDMHDQQVDDGRWRLLDEDTIDINGTAFDFLVHGDELRLEPVEVGTCPINGRWCLEAWKLMVAMPGMAWTRAEG